MTRTFLKKCRNLFLATILLAICLVGEISAGWRIEYPKGHPLGITQALPDGGLIGLDVCYKYLIKYNPPETLEYLPLNFYQHTRGAWD